MLDTQSDHKKLVSTTKSYREILRDEIATGRTELQRPSLGLFLSGISAGLDVGFSLLAMAITLTLVGDVHPVLKRILYANAYALGFVFVNLGRSELFTEHTTLMMFPVLAGEETPLRMLRVWGTVYAGNLIGATVFAIFAPFFGIQFSIINPAVLAEISHHLVKQHWWLIILSGVLTGWAIGLVSWLVAATVDTIGQIVCVWLVTSFIGYAQLHHCIVGSVEVIAGIWSPAGLSFWEYGHFLLWTTLGNILGGMMFATMKYTHSVRAHE